LLMKLIGACCQMQVLRRNRLATADRLSEGVGPSHIDFMPRPLNRNRSRMPSVPPVRDRPHHGSAKGHFGREFRATHAVYY
jgi:hypothetical protein